MSRRKELEDLANVKGVGSECIYNVGQTGLLYQKLPKSIYVEKKSKKHPKEPNK